jgi:hypothetical protein
MRVIGVTTTLPAAAMAAVGPDRIEPTINRITVEDIRGLVPREGAFDGLPVVHPPSQVPA